MKKWLLIGITFVILVGLIAALMINLNRKNEDELSKDTAAVVEDEGGWKTIEHKAYGISIRVPSVWGISVFEFGSGDIAGLFIDDDTNVEFEVYIIDNIGDQNNLTDIYPSYSREEVKVSGVSGIKYVGKKIAWDVYDEGAEGVDPLIEDSYLVGMQFIQGDKTLRVICSATGSEYTEYISVCEEVIKSLQINI